MEKIVWDKSYSVGHSEMDIQHQIIIGAINRCVDLIAGELDSGEVEIVLQSLSQYAEEHFKAEESLLETHGFDFVQAQKNSHAVYQMKMESYLNREMDQGGLVEMVKFLNFWWMHHIQVEDMEYKKLFE